MMTMSFKEAYGYDQNTKAFIGMVYGFLDPMSSTADIPVYILPANATWMMPPADELVIYTRFVFDGESWQVAPDYDALRAQISVRRQEAEAEIWRVDDMAARFADRIQSNPQDETLQAEFQKLIAVADEWKQYQQALLRMEEGVESLDIAEINWPEMPDLQ